MAGTEFEAIGSFPSMVTSKVIYMDNTTIYTAKLTAGYNNTIQFELSADNGANWEIVTPNVRHTFTNTGTQLKWRAVGAYPSIINWLKVEYHVY